MDKTRRILDERLKPAGAFVIDEARVPHDASHLAHALAMLATEGADLLIAFGASAITDENDVIPAAIRSAGGEVSHFGMPVDPGNLLLIGELDGKPVLGAPGCARSPAENGFDWVLNRLLAGLEVSREDITGMGVGGLLMEIVSRPQPREPAAAEGDKKVAAIILAAGQARRMGGPNKLTARFDGEPLVRRVTEHALKSKAGPVIVVTGHRSAEITSALSGLDVQMVDNPDYADGLATSLKAGLAAAPERAFQVVHGKADVVDARAPLGDEPADRRALRLRLQQLHERLAGREPGDARAVCVVQRDLGHPQHVPVERQQPLDRAHGDADVRDAGAAAGDFWHIYVVPSVAGRRSRRSRPGTRRGLHE